MHTTAAVQWDICTRIDSKLRAAVRFCNEEVTVMNGLEITLDNLLYS